MIKKWREIGVLQCQLHMFSSKRQSIYSPKGNPHISQLMLPGGFAKVQCRQDISISVVAGVRVPEFVADLDTVDDGVLNRAFPSASFITIFNVFQPSMFSSSSILASLSVMILHNRVNSSSDSVCVDRM